MGSECSRRSGITIKTSVKKPANVKKSTVFEEVTTSVKTTTVESKTKSVESRTTVEATPAAVVAEPLVLDDDGDSDGYQSASDRNRKAAVDDALSMINRFVAKNEAIKTVNSVGKKDAKAKAAVKDETPHRDVAADLFAEIDDMLDGGEGDNAMVGEAMEDLNKIWDEYSNGQSKNVESVKNKRANGRGSKEKLDEPKKPTTTTAPKRVTSPTRALTSPSKGKSNRVQIPSILEGNKIGSNLPDRKKSSIVPTGRSKLDTNAVLLRCEERRKKREVVKVDSAPVSSVKQALAKLEADAGGRRLKPKTSSARPRSEVFRSTSTGKLVESGGSKKGSMDSVLDSSDKESSVRSATSETRLDKLDEEIDNNPLLRHYKSPVPPNKVAASKKKKLSLRKKTLSKAVPSDAVGALTKMEDTPAAQVNNNPFLSHYNRTQGSIDDADEDPSKNIIKKKKQVLKKKRVSTEAFANQQTTTDGRPASRTVTEEVI